MKRRMENFLAFLCVLCREKSGLGCPTARPVRCVGPLLHYCDNHEYRTHAKSKSGEVHLLSPPYRKPEVLVQLEGYPKVWGSAPKRS